MNGLRKIRGSSGKGKIYTLGIQNNSKGFVGDTGLKHHLKINHLYIKSHKYSLIKS